MKSSKIHSAGYLDTRYSVGEVDEVGEVGTCSTESSCLLCINAYLCRQLVGRDLIYSMYEAECTCSSDLWAGTG
jgi:hypothetical protein